MSGRRLIPLRDPTEIPANMTEQQAREFWDTHEITDEYLERAGPVSQDALPAAESGTRTVTLRLPADTFRLAKMLAKEGGVTPQDVLTEALAEWWTAKARGVVE